jgi:hypothetical protein
MPIQVTVLETTGSTGKETIVPITIADGIYNVLSIFTACTVSVVYKHRSADIIGFIYQFTGCKVRFAAVVGMIDRLRFTAASTNNRTFPTILTGFAQQFKLI